MHVYCLLIAAPTVRCLAVRLIGPIGSDHNPMLAPDQTRQSAVFDHLRHSILTGTLPGGGRLPPSRSLAQELGVARQTVVLAYERLAAEGYVRGRTGSGTYVATDLPDRPLPRPPPRSLAAAALSARGARLAEVPASRLRPRPGAGPAAGRRPARARPVPDQGLGALRIPRSETPVRRVASYPPPQGLHSAARANRRPSGRHPRPGR